MQPGSQKPLRHRSKPPAEPPAEPPTEPSAEPRAEPPAVLPVKPPTDHSPRLPAGSPAGLPAQSQLDLGGPPLDLDSLRQAASGCRECPLGEPATQTVWGEGRPRARLMLVGEQPGDREDIEGRPFVGPAGRLLDRGLEALGWPRKSLYVTNAVKHFKFEVRGKRRMHKTPGQREAAACLHWLESEIAAVRPSAIVALGAVAARSLLGRSVSVMRDRGQWHEREDGIPVLLTLHPSALLRGDRAELEAAFEAWVSDLRHAASHLQA